MSFRGTPSPSPSPMEGEGEREGEGGSMLIDTRSGVRILISVIGEPSGATTTYMPGESKTRVMPAAYPLYLLPEARRDKEEKKV